MGVHKNAEKYFGLKYSFGLFKNNIRINVIYNDAHLDGKFSENKHSAKFEFETARQRVNNFWAAPTRPTKKGTFAGIFNVDVIISTVFKPFTSKRSVRVTERLALPTLVTGSRVRIPLEARFFPNLNGTSLHRAFHVHPSIVSK